MLLKRIVKLIDNFVIIVANILFFAIKLNFMKKRLELLLIIVVVCLSSCMTSTVLNVIKPADVYIPNDITTFAVVQRNEARKGEKLAKRIEGLFSGEGIGMDKRSANYALRGLILQLSKSPRYMVKEAHTNKQLYGTGTRNMAEPLEWQEVKDICEANNSDALIVVEAFDSDVSRNVNHRDVTKTVSGGQVTERVYNSKLTVTVEVGWRIYYPKTQLIVDNYNHEKTNSRRASGATEIQSNANLPEKESVVKLTARQLGEEYGRRISPSRVNLRRSYYGSGNYVFKTGKQKFIEKNYDAAIDIWLNEFETTLNQKAKGKSAYNMAVAYEVKADYQNAIYWAEEAIQNRNKKAKKYLAILRERVEEERRLEKQMKVE